jgi:hypothetical protein
VVRGKLQRLNRVLVAVVGSDLSASSPGVPEFDEVILSTTGNETLEGVPLHAFDVPSVTL